MLQRQRRWLGAVRVPFAFLLAQGGLRAELRLDAPAANLGYRAPAVAHIDRVRAASPNVRKIFMSPPRSYLRKG